MLLTKIEVLKHAVPFCESNGFSKQKLEREKFQSNEVMGFFTHSNPQSEPINHEKEGWFLDGGEKYKRVPTLFFEKTPSGFEFKTTEYTDRFLRE